MDLFSKRNPDQGRRTLEIKSRISNLLELSQDVTVMVTELNCRDEDCPEVETVIAIFRPGRQKVQGTLHSGIDEITDEEIERFCRSVQDPTRLSEMPLAGSDQIH
jgi:hypothetical protein